MSTVGKRQVDEFSLALISVAMGAVRLRHLISSGVYRW
jgi:hypothetical protein